MSEGEWEAEVIVVEDADGSVLGHSQSTDAYRVYGDNEDLALRVAEAQGIAHGQSGADVAEHFRRTADTRDELSRQLANRNR